jgi:hypothetical protein
MHVCTCPVLETLKSNAPASRLRHGQRGAGRLKVIVWLAILGSMVFAGVKVIPILFSEYQFQDAMQTTARYASVNRQSPADISATLAKEAQVEDLPVQPEDIHVTSDSGNVKISADYSVTVDLKVYQLTLNFHPSASNNALL